MINHQQIPEGQAFVEPRDVETARGLIAAAEALEVDPALVRTQQGGYLAPVDVVTKWQEDGELGDDVSVTEAPKPTAPDEPALQSTDDGDAAPEAPAKSASKGDWVEYATTQGYDESEGLTQAQLIERYGASE